MDTSQKEKQMSVQAASQGTEAADSPEESTRTQGWTVRSPVHT